MPATQPRAVTLYIVDDDTAVRSALQLLARVHGWQARGFESGADFLDSSIDEHDACVVLDLNMPGIDGDEVLRRLRARGSRLPVLLISGDREVSRMARTLKEGAQGTLTKPFGDQAFYAAIEACVAKR